MNGAVDLSYFSMLMCGLLMLLPIGAVWYFKLGITKNLLISTFRMSLQLVLIGFFLEFLFSYNHWLLNLLWFLVMISVAVYSVVDNSGLRIKHFAKPMLLSFIAANLLVVVYFNFFIARLDAVFDAKYIIAIGGMVLGNTLRANVVGIGDFYKSLKKDENRYLYQLSLGATRYEALLPFAKRSFLAAINPTIATMATMGIVSLPGMMTGQILGGSVPLVAIKYQIAIMVTILASTVLSIGLSVFFTSKYTISKEGILNKEVFK